MTNRINKDVLKRYLDGVYSPADYQMVKTWFKDPEFEQKLDQSIEENWMDFQEESKRKDLSTTLQKIQRQIYLDERKKQKSIWHLYRQIAAILLLPIIVLSAYFLLDSRYLSNDSWAEIHSPAGARTQFHLPDGTNGWLNSGSSIKYPINFIKREVKISGEVYFDVTKKNGTPFKVETSELEVVVLGTKFNVIAYEDDVCTEVVLEEGKVKLNGKKTIFSEILSPDDRFVFNSNQKTGEITKVDAPIYTSWKEGKLVFRDQPLSEVLKKMGRWYNVQFDIKDKDLMDYTYKATFVNETLDEMLKLLSYTAPIKYNIQDRKLKADGTFTIKNIIIERK